MIVLKTADEIRVMKEGGEIAARVLQKILQEASAGKSLLELDELADELILKSGASPSFKMEKNYLFATCMNLNDAVVHGIPTEEKLKDGDILNVDLGVYYKGFHTDTSWTIEVGDEKWENGTRGETGRFLDTGQKALIEAIKQCQPGKHIGDISKAIQEMVEGAGYSCVRQLVGHGIGRELHEDPEIPCFVRGKTANTPLIKEGMTLAIEVIYNMGEPEVVYKSSKDAWTIVTRDELPSAVFEHTVAVTKDRPEILTI